MANYFRDLFEVFSATSITLLSIWVDTILIDRYGYRRTILYLTFPEIIALLSGCFAIFFVLKHVGVIKIKDEEVKENV
jgi:hypothetical protein